MNFFLKRLLFMFGPLFSSILVMLWLSGCVASNMTEFAKALGQDPATVCFNLSTIYGQGKLYRTNCTNCNVSCNQEGLSITTAPPGTNIPVSVTPVDSTIRGK